MRSGPHPVRIARENANAIIGPEWPDLAPWCRSEIHQNADGTPERLTTAQGVVIADNQNSLRAGAPGPTLLEDFALRENIFHFDHERIPERVVHARAMARMDLYLHPRHGRRDPRAPFAEVGKQTEVFVRFSTVAGSKGPPDLARDIRGFAPFDWMAAAYLEKPWLLDCAEVTASLAREWTFRLLPRSKLVVHPPVFTDGVAGARVLHCPKASATVHDLLVSP